MQASTSSRVSCGYWSRISSTVVPAARRSRIRDTQIRCPLMNGLPKQMSGLIEMRWSNSACPMGVTPFDVGLGGGSSFDETRDNRVLAVPTGPHDHSCPERAEQQAMRFALPTETAATSVPAPKKVGPSDGP